MVPALLFWTIRIDAYTRTVLFEILLGKQEDLFEILLGKQEDIPSLRIAMIRTMKGEKSYFQIKAMSINPSCKTKFILGCRERKPYISVNFLCLMYIPQYGW
jgi:hypothetical protein